MAKRGTLPGAGRRLAVRLLFFVALLAPPTWGYAGAPDGNWSLVNTAQRTLTVYSGDGRRLAEYRAIALGSGGVAAVHYHGDRTTPRGHYRIMRVRASRHFDTFYQLDYPTAEHAEQATRRGRLSAASGDAVLAAVKAGRLPPQNTALGGAIGIHGVGTGDLRIHREFDWTNGCVALTNEQLHDFARFAVVGMRVVIE